MITDKIDIEQTEPEQISPVNDDINTDYQFANGNIDPDDALEQFIEDFQKPKEETGIPEEPDSDELPDDMLEDAVTTEQARYTAAFIVDATDEIMAQGLALCSKNHASEHRAGKEQKKHLKELWTRYCKQKGTEIPLGWQITLAMLTVYGSQIPKALEDRKINEARKQLEEDRNALRYDRMLLEEEKLNMKRKQQTEQIINDTK